MTRCASLPSLCKGLVLRPKIHLGSTVLRSKQSAHFRVNYTGHDILRMTKPWPVLFAPFRKVKRVGACGRAETSSGVIRVRSFLVLMVASVTSELLEKTIASS